MISSIFTSCSNYNKPVNTDSNVVQEEIPNTEEVVTVIDPISSIDMSLKTK